MQALGNSISDEKVIYIMVFNTLKGMGLKFETITNSNQQYVQILNDKYQAFLTENDKLLKTTIGSRQQKITDIANDNALKKKEIQDLQKQIEDNDTLAEKISQEIHNESSNIEEAKSAFNSAYSKISSEFISIGNKCKQYLKQ